MLAGVHVVLFSFIEEPVQQVEREYQKRNSLEVKGVPKSSDFGSGRCPDTPKTDMRAFVKSVSE